MDERLKALLSEQNKEESRILAGESAAPDYLTDGMIDSKRLMSAGRGISVRRHTRYAEFPEHSHNYIEMVYMCEGSTTHLINSTTRLTLETGDILLLNQHARHRIELAGEGDIAVNIIIMPEFFDSALELAGGGNMFEDFLAAGLRSADEGVSCLHFSVSDDVCVRNTAETLIWEHCIGNADSRTLKLCLSLLLTELMSGSRAVTLSESPRGESAMTARILSRIEEDYSGVSLSQIADEYGVSAAYVSRAVKRVTGRTFKELLVQKRITKAKKLLSETDLSVSDVCFAVGYDNTSYFHRLFYRICGCTPGEFRQDRLKKDAK